MKMVGVGVGVGVKPYFTNRGQCKKAQICLSNC